MLWGNEQEGKQRGLFHQIGDVIEEVFRPTAKRQEILLQKIIEKLDRENADQDEKNPREGKHSSSACPLKLIVFFLRSSIRLFVVRSFEL